MQSSVVVQRSESQNQLSNYDLYLILDCVAVLLYSCLSSVQTELPGWQLDRVVALDCRSVASAVCQHAASHQSDRVHRSNSCIQPLFSYSAQPPCRSSNRNPAMEAERSASHPSSIPLSTVHTPPTQLHSLTVRSNPPVILSHSLLLFHSLPLPSCTVAVATLPAAAVVVVAV